MQVNWLEIDMDVFLVNLVILDKSNKQQIYRLMESHQKINLNWVILFLNAKSLIIVLVLFITRESVQENFKQKSLKNTLIIYHFLSVVINVMTIRFPLMEKLFTKPILFLLIHQFFHSDLLHIKQQMHHILKIMSLKKTKHHVKKQGQGYPLQLIVLFKKWP